MTEKRFSTNGYYIYDHFKEDKWLVNEVEVKYIVTKMNNLDIKARERSKALSKLQKENEQLKRVIAENEKLIQSTYDELTKLRCIKKNLGRIKAQWDWIMEAIQYD